MHVQRPKAHMRFFLPSDAMLTEAEKASNYSVLNNYYLAMKLTSQLTCKANYACLFKVQVCVNPWLLSFCYPFLFIAWMFKKKNKQTN